MADGEMPPAVGEGEGETLALAGRGFLLMRGSGRAPSKLELDLGDSKFVLTPRLGAGASSGSSRWM